MRQIKDIGLFFDVGLSAVDLTCTKCCGIISTDGNKSDDCIPFVRKSVEFAGVECPKCGNKEFDMTIYADVYCYQPKPVEGE